MGRALQPIFPLSVMWVLLMHRLSRSMAPVDAMCCSVDSKLWYNAALYRLLGLTHLARAFFPATGVQVLLQAMAFEQSAPLA
jgi:hypothetical protein